MEPITMIVLALLAAAGTAAVGWGAVQNWVESHRVRGGAAKLLRRRLENGQYKVVGGVFDAGGTRIATNEWTGTLEADLAARFGSAAEIVVRY
jgi:hypothetical protein